MALCYKKIWKLLIARDMTRADLREATGVSPATFAKMSKGEPVGAGILDRICESMNCNIGDIVDHVPDVSVQANADDGVNREGRDICRK